MFLSSFRFDRHSIRCLVSCDLPVPVCVLGKIHIGRVLNRKGFTITHGSKRIVKAISRSIVCISFFGVDLNIVVKSQGIAADHILNINVRHISFSSHGYRIGEFSSLFIIHCRLHSVSLPRLRFDEDKVTFYRITELDMGT